MLLADHNGDLHLDTPIRFLREPGKPDLRIPALGEHTIAVLAEADHDSRIKARAFKASQAPHGWVKV
jgi:crotonobetainyl-CoA:carnitine CoA-transferase CaiB-like acyl-CoA transferase